MNNHLGKLFVLFCTLVLSCLASEVIILDTKNFEHLTQASTGSTTGDWLIEFYAPWCGHCKKLEPIYDQLAENLKGDINVAKVDVTQNRELGTRFEIKGFPTIKFLSKGKVYTFKGRRTVEDITEFCKGGYQINVPEDVKPPMGIFGEITYIYKHAYKQATADLKKGKFFTTDVFLTFLPVIFILLITLLVCIPSPSPPPRRGQRDGQRGGAGAGEQSYSTSSASGANGGRKTVPSSSSSGGSGNRHPSDNIQTQPTNTGDDEGEEEEEGDDETDDENAEPDVEPDYDEAEPDNQQDDKKRK
jgi:protein disulfide-isomerase-like protein